MSGNPSQDNAKNPEGELVWYCVQSRPKQEHIAAASILQFPGIEVYCPFLRIQRTLSRGKVWFKEALFPCYVFARFDLNQSLRAVAYANGVSKILRFGDDFATVPDSAIEAIRAEMGGELIKEVVLNPRVGDEGEMAAGPLKGFNGIIQKVHDGTARVRILIEFLGGLREVDVEIPALRTPRHAREFVSLSKNKSNPKTNFKT